MAALGFLRARDVQHPPPAHVEGAAESIEPQLELKRVFRADVESFADLR